MFSSFKDERLIETALKTAGSFTTELPDYVIYLINGHYKTMKKAPFTTLLVNVCEHHAISFINNLGKSLLKLPMKYNKQAPVSIDISDKDFDCTRAILNSLGATVQLTTRFVTFNGQAINQNGYCLLLRVDDNQYIQGVVDDNFDTPLASLVRQAMAGLIRHIFEKNKKDNEKIEAERKKEARKVQQAQYRAAKKLRHGPAPDDSPAPQTDN